MKIELFIFSLLLGLLYQIIDQLDQILLTTRKGFIGTVLAINNESRHRVDTCLPIKVCLVLEFQLDTERAGGFQELVPVYPVLGSQIRVIVQIRQNTLLDMNRLLSSVR